MSPNFKRTFSLVLLAFVCTNKINAQVLLSDTSGIFSRGYEFSGLTHSASHFYLMSEKCKTIFIGDPETAQYKEVNLSLSSLPFTDFEFEGVCFYKDSILFACDEKNTKIIAIDIARNIATIVDLPSGFEDWAGNLGMEGIAIDKLRGKLFLLRERVPNENASELRVFNLIDRGGSFSLKVSDTILIRHSSLSYRYSDITYDEHAQKAYLIRSFFSGVCSSNKYIIDTINTNRLSTSSDGRRLYQLNSDNLQFLDISTKVNSYCGRYNTNLEGITVSGSNLYVISDNLQTSVPICDRPAQNTLFLKFSITNTQSSSSSASSISSSSSIPLIDCTSRNVTIRQRFSSSDSAKGWQRSVTLPLQGRFVEEAHYLTTEDKLVTQYPVDSADGISSHLDRSYVFYKRYDSTKKFDRLYRYKNRRVWTPSENGKIGQGAIGDLQLSRLKPEDELWMMNMMWDRGERPSIGTKFLVSANGKNVVVVAGYETGPQESLFLGGITGEVHEWLGTTWRSRSISVALLQDQNVRAGPCFCK